jgi:hypothetical protein
MIIISTSLGGRAAAQFDKTNDIAFADVTGFPIALEAGKTYNYRAWLQLTLDAVGGGKLRITGGATATAIVESFKSLNIAGGAFGQILRNVAIGQTYNITIGFTTVEVEISGAITVNAAGSFNLQFAQQVANGTSSVLRGSHILVFAT